ncbi:receptor-like protein EIX2 [Silene latifolia]|uniref:receptor-like protein EIX2 n=1 Tax=Silene latifolia TaxID=37657 RepID=UPI003D78A6FD
MGNLVKTCLLIYTFIFFNTTRCCSCNAGNSANHLITVKCKPSERAALLNFKHNLTYFAKEVSSSWEGQECCEWRRVGCDNTTGHILKLDLNGVNNNHLLKMEKLESLAYLLELKQLERLDLSYNNFSYSSIPRYMGLMRQLRYLNFSSSSLGGLVPCQLGNLTNLLVLDLSFNKLFGEIPACLGTLSNLKELNVSQNNLSSIASSLRWPLNLEFLILNNNRLSGKIPTSLGKLSKLQFLDISYNLLEGTVLSEPHFANFSKLTYLYMDHAMLTINLSSNWVPPFQLRSFVANHCKINGRLPPWLQTQKNLSYLDLSNANISGVMPNWFHTMQQLVWLELYNNNLSGSPIFPINFSCFKLSNNSLSWDFLSNYSKTEVYHQAQDLDLSHNFIYGPFLEGLSHTMPNLKTLYLTNNQISGRIPNSLCQLTSLCALDIEYNSLSGVIPKCWTNISTLSCVRLSYNKLEGHIPCFNNKNINGFDPHFYLHLNDNMLSGEVPSCLSNLTYLSVLNIGGNQLSGEIFNLFRVDKLKKLQILRLRGNQFSGSIPRKICFLPRLQIMDFGHNHFTGYIPRCLSNIKGMTSPVPPLDFSHGVVSEVMQGIERPYTSSLPYLVDIDLSCNNLVGNIPHDMTKIYGLMGLNLSYNQLSGTIPENIGALKSLISLDLSKNKLRGSIPTSISQIYTLSHLNLSYNNLSGQIPTGNQLQTLSDQASIYAGNPYLCGDFLPKKCKSKEDEQDKGRSNKDKGGNKEKLEKMGLDLVVMSGFATGFWGVVGCLVLNRRWRLAFFRYIEDGYNWLYVIVALKVRVAKAKINRR